MRSWTGCWGTGASICAARRWSSRCPATGSGPPVSSRGAIAKVVVDAATTRRLAEVSSGVNATPFMVFLAGFVAVLSRYTRQQDIVTGTQVAGRTHAELDPIIGLFTNTIPLRISLAGEPTFTELIGRVRDITLDGLSHQQIPFEKLVDEFVPDRTLGLWPLIQVLFVYGSLTPPTLDIPGVAARSQALLTGTAKLDLLLYADTQDGGSTMLAMEYSTDAFSPVWAQRFLGCVAHLLEEAANAPDRAVADLAVLSAAEQAALVAGRNPPPASLDEHHVDVRQLLQAATSRVVDGDETLPMSQVCDRAARLAQALAERGVGPETLVGLCVGRGIGMLTAMLGVWWAGGAYVPLDPGFPPARLTAMARGADLQIVITDAANRDLAQSVGGGAAIVCIDDPAVAATPPLAPVPVPATALAYVIFTSGSTGQPKGVGVEHRAVRNLLTSFQRTLELGPDDRFVAVTTLSFDIALLELLLPAVSGATS